MLWAERHKYHGEIGADNHRTKMATVGMLQLLAQKLFEQGDFDKAAEVLFKIVKIEGWAGPDNQVNVFHGLTARDYADIKKTLKGESDHTEPSIEGDRGTTPELPN